jgi:hypothetical protein
MKFPPPGVGWGTAYKSQPAQPNYRGRVALRLPSMKAGCSPSEDHRTEPCVCPFFSTPAWGCQPKKADTAVRNKDFVYRRKVARADPGYSASSKLALPAVLGMSCVSVSTQKSGVQSPALPKCPCSTEGENLLCSAGIQPESAFRMER